MTPLLSVITACYNHGVYLDDAFDSINLKKYGNVIEHIIVNDGSTDSFTINKLNELEEKGSVVIHQKNMGLGAARNAGISAAKGRYYIPLDCDNMIVPEIALQCCNILEKDAAISVVYTDAQYFGEQNSLWKVGDIDVLKMLDGNYIDACAVIRREAWQHTGGYAQDMPAMGHEDWDLWLNILFNDGKFFYLKKVGFHYRVVANSMSVNFTRPGFLKNKEYIFSKYANQISTCYHDLYICFLQSERKINDMEFEMSNNKIKACAKILLGKSLINSKNYAENDN